MTKKQIEICKKVVKYRNLNKILFETGVSDYFELQVIMGEGVLRFSDTEMDECTEVFLSDSTMEEFENRREKSIDTLFTRGMAIAAFVISLIALLGQLGILQLRQC